MTFTIKLAGDPLYIRDEFMELVEAARKSAITTDEQKAIAAASFSVHRSLDFARVQHIPQMTIEASGVTDYRGAGFAAKIIVKTSVEFVFGFVPDPDAEDVEILGMTR